MPRLFSEYLSRYEQIGLIVCTWSVLASPDTPKWAHPAKGQICHLIIYICVCVCVHTFIHACIYVYVEREREMFYLTMHSTHFIYGYMTSDIWLRTILIVRKETRCRHIGCFYRLTARICYMHHPTDRITHTTAFITPVVEHWLECMYACMHVCFYVCIDVCMYLCMCNVFVCACKYACICMRVLYTYLRVCVCACAYVCMIFRLTVTRLKIELLLFYHLGQTTNSIRIMTR